MLFKRSLLALALAAAVPSPPAVAAGGGGAAPPPATAAPAPGDGGGTAVGQPVKRKPPATRRGPAARRRKRGARRRPPAPRLTAFSVSAKRVYSYGRPARVRFRLAGRGTVRVRLRLVPKRAGARATSIALGWRRTGVTHVVALTGRAAAGGDYVLRIAGRDRRGRGLRRAARASSRADVALRGHAHPLAGPFTYGGSGSLFGASRGDRIHRGQDMAAAEGTPLVAPRGGVVEAVQYQAGGAGHYVVLDGEGEERDYVFMHLRTGSIVVREGQRVLTGQRIGAVGNTGSSTGPHLHFEVWSGQWYGGGHPIDPLPLLRAWSR